MRQDIVGDAEAILMGEQPRQQRRSVDLWRLVGLYGVVLLLLVGFVWCALQLVPAAQERQEAAAAKREAEQEAFAAFYDKPLWDRIPQVPVEEVTAFAEDFLRRLGYTPHGEVVASGWSTTFASGGAYKQYHYYAVIHPGWPPLRLRCGPSGYDAMVPLSCHVFPERD